MSFLCMMSAVVERDGLHTEKQTCFKHTLSHTHKYNGLAFNMHLLFCYKQNELIKHPCIYSVSHLDKTLFLKCAPRCTNTWHAMLRYHTPVVLFLYNCIEV